MKKIFLHVGLPKTGTTTIQETLKKNYTLLLKNNYLYPQTLPANHSVPFIQFFREQNSKFNENIDYLHKWDKNKFADELLKMSDIDNLIISGEAIITFDKNELSNIINFFKDIGFNPEYEIIIYVRNPIDFINSLTQQRVKLLRTPHKMRSGRLKKQIKLFQKTFCNSKINIIKFEDSFDNKYGLVGQFSNMIGLSPELLSYDISQKFNESTSNQSYEIYDYIRFFYQFCEENNNKVFFDKKLLSTLKQLSGNKFSLTNEEKVKIFKKSCKDSKWIEKNYNISFPSAYNPLETKPKLIYDEIYKKEILEILETVPEQIMFLIFKFLNYKINFSSIKEHSSIFNELKIDIEQKYPILLTNKYVIKNETILTKKYHKIKSSKYPHQIF